MLALHAVQPEERALRIQKARGDPTSEGRREHLATQSFPVQALAYIKLLNEIGDSSLQVLPRLYHTVSLHVNETAWDGKGSPSFPGLAGTKSEKIALANP